MTSYEKHEREFLAAWPQTVRAAIEGDPDWIEWRDATPRSKAEVADALDKLMRLGGVLPEAKERQP